MTTKYYKFNPNAHCASICQFGDGVLIACYKGPECSNEQQVVVIYDGPDRELTYKALTKRTGNCVLTPMTQNKASLIFSYFMDTNGMETVASGVERWRFCSNWKTMISLDNELTFDIMKNFEVGPSIGALVRCNPTRYFDYWLLPLYTEHNCYGIIAASEDGYKWSHHGYLGKTQINSNSRFGNGVLIQPTLWQDGICVKSLSRDITKNRRAWYSESHSNGDNWSVPIQTNLWNHNNSVVVFKLNNIPFVIWNQGPNRSQLMLGSWSQSNLSATPAIMLNQSFNASYPNCCIDKNGKLHIVHTDFGKIAHHIFDKEMIDGLCSLDDVKSLWSAAKVEEILIEV